MSLERKFRPLVFQYTEAGPISMLKGCISRWPWVVNSPARARELCNYYSAQTLQRLARARVNFIVVTWSVGFSRPAEASQQGSIVEFMRRCRARGIGVGLYISWCNLFRDNMASDVPQSGAWWRVYPDGSPMLYGSNPERHMGCVNNPGWWNYLKKTVARAVRAGPDAIVFDNVDSWCFCPYCQRFFAAFTLRRFGCARESDFVRDAGVVGDQELGSRYDAVRIAQMNLSGRVAVRDSWMLVANRLFAEERNAARLRAMVRFIRRLNPRVAVSANVHERVQSNAALDFVFTETPEFPGLDGRRFYANVALYKLLQGSGAGQATGMALLGQRRAEAGRNPRIEKLALAEGYVFGVPAQAHQMREFLHPDYNAFFRRHWDCLVRPRAAAQVLLVVDDFFARSACRVQNNLAVQLARRQVGFDVLPLEFMRRGRLQSYPVVVCCACAALSADQLRLLRQLAARGQTILILEPFALLRPNLRPWPAPARAALYALKNVSVWPAGIALGDPRNLAGQAPDAPAEFWNLISRATDWELRLEPGGALLGHLVRTASGRETALHLLNYSTKRMRVRVQLNAQRLGLAPADIQVFSPARPGGRRLAGRIHGKTLEITVPEMEIYSLIRIRPRAG